jgi:DNA repair and recombination protein RAD52
MTFTPQQITELTAPLDLKHVKKPSGSFGPKGDYLEGWHVINELNRVFGFDGWSYTIDLTRDALAEGKDSKGQPQWQAAYTCICTLTVGGVTRQDVGFGSGFAKGIGDAVEGATKEAVTDALKRCARTFGNIFGLALYDKSRANVQAMPEALPPAVEQMLAGIKACQTIAALNEWKAANAKAANASGFGELIVGEWTTRRDGLQQVANLGAG